MWELGGGGWGVVGTSTCSNVEIYSGRGVRKSGSSVLPSFAPAR